MLSQVLDVLDGRGMSQRKCATLNEAAAMIARTLGMDRLELAQRLCDPDAEPTLLAALYVISGANNRGRSKQHVETEPGTSAQHGVANLHGRRRLRDDLEP